jgi:hypothetical protein
MALLGAVSVSSSGVSVVFSTGDAGFRAHLLALNNLGPGGILLDIHSTSAGSTGFQIDAATPLVLTGLGGIQGFSAVASTAGGVPELSFLASR